MYPGNYNIAAAILTYSVDGKQAWEVTYTGRRPLTKDGKPGFMVLQVGMDQTVERIRNEWQGEAKKVIAPEELGCRS